jgi:hypothetical protein
MAGTRHQKSKQRAFKLALLVPPSPTARPTGNALFSNLTFGHDALGAMQAMASVLLKPDKEVKSENSKCPLPGCTLPLLLFDI